jgi:hypothetical protein
MGYELVVNFTPRVAYGTRIRPFVNLRALIERGGAQGSTSIQYTYSRVQILLASFYCALQQLKLQLIYAGIFLYI